MLDNKMKCEGARVLLVEGSDDYHVIVALCKKFGVPEQFGLYVCEGDDQVIKRLNALHYTSNIPDVVGVVIDADRPNLAGRWLSIVHKLKDARNDLPAIPDSLGTIIENKAGMPKLGFWLMPNNKLDGMLEHFCGEMIPSDALQTVEQCLGIASAAGHTTYKAIHYQKAVVHTYLAWQDEPGKPLGQAITAQVLNSETTTTDCFINWLTKLFS